MKTEGCYTPLTLSLELSEPTLGVYCSLHIEQIEDSVPYAGDVMMFCD
jgi:hypothetical protein